MGTISYQYLPRIQALELSGISQYLFLFPIVWTSGILLFFNWPASIIKQAEKSGSIVGWRQTIVLIYHLVGVTLFIIYDGIKFNEFEQLVQIWITDSNHSLIFNFNLYTRTGSR